MISKTAGIGWASGCCLRVLVVEGVDVGEHDEQVGVDLAGDQGAEPVVVAEGGADLGGADAVVLIEDRDDAEMEQRLDGVAEVQIGLAVAEDLGGQQHLGDLDAVQSEGLAVLLHQQRLADRGTGLPHLHLVGLLRQAELAGAHADGPGGDDHDLPAAVEQGLDLCGHPAEVGGVDPAVLGQGVRADLDDHPFCLAEITHNSNRSHYTACRRPFKVKTDPWSSRARAPRCGRFTPTDSRSALPGTPISGSA